MKSLLSKFFNLRLRGRPRAMELDNPPLLQKFAPVFARAQQLGFTEPILRGGAVRDALLGKEINDYDLYVSRVQIAEGLELPSIHAPHADDFYRSWLSSRLELSSPEAHRQRLMDRPYLAFEVRFDGADHAVDLVINDEALSPEKLALEADATMNAVAASRNKIVAHPLFWPDTQAHIYRPTCATVGNLISAPARYRAKFAKRDGGLRYKWF